jgi:Glycine/D-amino acid oxidases (deaminating)
MRFCDAIVVGLGAMGSSTLCHLAQRGHRVLGIEQFPPGHQLGSSHGDSRIIREQYFEHPLYVPLVQRAYDLWRELEDRTGHSLMTITGGLMIGPPDGMVVSGTIRSATTHHLPYEVLDPTEVHARYPAFRLADGLVAVLDPLAGFSILRYAMQPTSMRHDKRARKCTSRSGSLRGRPMVTACEWAHPPAATSPTVCSSRRARGPHSCSVT